MINLSININQTGEKYIPFWKKCITAGRAAEGLREEWRNQLREIQKEIGFEYIRFHGIFHDEMMIYTERPDGTPIYNWLYFDSLFDFLLSVGLRPILELGFMPAALASGDKTVFWWKGNSTPPKDYDKWYNLVRELVCHCINCYGLTEVLKWYFEVWNEPNLDAFWSGTQEEYFKLYKYTAMAIKSVDKRLKVGGPATSGADFRDSSGRIPYVEAFIDFCSKNGLPVDFITAHPYPTYWPLDDEGVKSMGYMDQNSTYDHLNRIRNVVDNSPFKDAEIHLTEWSSSPSPRDLVHDTAFMAPYIIYNNIKCIGLVDSLGFWAFTDIFEENVSGLSMFHGGFGLINLKGLKKPSFYGYWFLSRLGNERILSGENYFVARKDDIIQILLWNFRYYTDSFAKGNRKALTQYERYSVFKDGDETFNLTVDGLRGKYRVISYIFGRENGSAFDIWLKNGAPAYPTQEEIEIISKKTGPDGAIRYIDGINTLNQEIVLKPHDVMLIEICPQY